MRKRMFTLGLTIGIALTGTTAVFAADFVKAYLYPVKLVINGQAQNMPPSSGVLNYNNQAYVPLRFVGEKLGVKVGYEEGVKVEDTAITLDTPNQGKDPERLHPPVLDQDFIAEASKGKLKGIEIELNTSKRELLKKWGVPDEIGEVHSEFYRYGNVTLYFSADDVVHVIDVKLDLAPAQVRTVMGKADYDGISEGGYEEYMLGYKAGINYLYFTFQEENSTSGKLRFKNPM
ncbi:DUF4309 domain-containing protein [Paenibacillus lutrae]|uniref:DUF4309 domain-containing protein n=1 Tax=Paenibacillus lutrae TaxID=2078573 RepID=UPI0014137042